MSQNGYFINPEESAEMARLLTQEGLLNEAMGGPLPERDYHLSSVHHILDIGSGPGGWCLEIAAKYPHIEVTGIDISQQMIGYAQAQAQAQGLHNVHFLMMDATQPLTFDDTSFDLVNGRYLVGFMRGNQWSALMRECYRITRSGGIFRSVETELSGLSNSAAYNQSSSLFIRAMQAAARSLTPGGPSIGLMAPLTQLALDAGYHDVQVYPYLLDFSPSSPIHGAMYENFQAGFRLMVPFLERYTGMSNEELEHLYQATLLGMSSPTFRGYMDLHAIVATKL